jgi:methyl-accepting chemotaxis protein
MVTEEGSKGAERGVDLVNRAGETIRDLAATLQEVTQAAVQIAASTHQQTNGMNQLGSAMQQIKQASTQAAASSRQTEQSARDLTDMSRRLDQAVARYKLEA